MSSTQLYLQIGVDAPLSNVSLPNTPWPDAPLLVVLSNQSVDDTSSNMLIEPAHKAFMKRKCHYYSKNASARYSCKTSYRGSPMTLAQFLASL